MKSALLVAAILLPAYHGFCEVEPSVSQAYPTSFSMATDDTGGKQQGFKLLRMSHGKTADGAPFSQNTFMAPADVIIYWTMVHYDSSKHAQDNFDAKIKDAIKLVERKQLLGADGHTTGQRAVFTYEAKDQKIHGMVLTVSGADLRIVESTSLQDAIQLDRLREN
jgi:hypothetical protein